MPTLAKIYQDLHDDPTMSLYYSNNFHVSSRKPWVSTKCSKAFIDDYLEFGGKGALLKISRDGTNLEFIQKRYKHIVSTYYLGIHLFNMISNQKRIMENPFQKPPFLYSWFITCLSHDLGYAFENKKMYKCYINHIEKGGIAAFYQDFINTTPSDSIYMSFKKDYVDFYFKRRAQECQRIDHGIAGGILLYSNLLNALEEWKNLPYFDDENDTREYNHRPFKIPTNAEDTFAELADAVISHNVFITTMNKWLANDKMEEMPHDPFSMKNRPLTFILGLADTLEPMKKCGYKHTCLKHINIEMENDEKITIICDDTIDTTDYYKGIIDLNGWLNVTVTPGDRSIAINLV